MEKVVLKANLREKKSKSLNKTIRRSGRVPGVYYSKHSEPLSIEVLENSINPLVFTSETHLISLEIDNQENRDCVIKDVQFDPVTDKVIHFDLLGLTKNEKFQLEVPLQFVGSPIGIKEGGVLQTFLHKVEIECLPADIPQHLVINIQDLKLGDAIHVKDLNFEKITILNLPDSVIVAVTHPKVEKEPTPEEAAETPAEPEVISKEKLPKEEEK
jgi:large subunit ribosomal protein L25